MPWPHSGHYVGGQRQDLTRSNEDVKRDGEVGRVYAASNGLRSERSHEARVRSKVSILSKAASV